MITPMQKISIMCLESDSENTLTELRELGVLHVTPAKEASGTTAVDAHARIEEAKTALQTLECEAHHHHNHCTCDTAEEIDNVIKELYDLHEKYRHQSEHLINLQNLHHSYLPYGNFSPKTIESLAKRGIIVKLYYSSDIESIDIAEDLHLHLISQDKTGTYFAVIGEHDFEVDASEFHHHGKSLNEIEAEITTVELAIDFTEESCCKYAPCKQKIIDALHEREEGQRYAEVRDNLGRHGKISCLHGYCPTESITKIKQAAKEHGWGILHDDPEPEDEVPTLLKFPKWVTPIKAVLAMLKILPGYREDDISSVFLIFFSIFFAILIGDAGYGMLFLAITLFARSKMKKAPAYPFVLFGILSIATIIWGAVTGNYFGIQPDALPHLLKRIQISWLTGKAAQNNTMKLCFLIGAIHLTVAHVWNIVAIAPDKKALAQVGWIGLVWSMYLTALNMVLGIAFPAFFMPLFVGSLILILLFMTSPKEMKTEWIHHAMFPLSVVNCFVDIVSYIRLFAVGIASLSVAQSFNGMAMQLGWKHIWTIPFIALILLLGHALNITLCALGILVHGIRLNTLEFSLHKNLEWKGIAYNPFERKKKLTTE